MHESTPTRCTAFEGSRCIASGEIVDVVKRAKEVFDQNEQANIQIFDDVTSDLIGIDFRGTMENILKRLADKTGQDASAAASHDSDLKEPRGPGRPKLGVVAREVTLLPRHWDWLNTQPGGASVALRKLVEKAKRENAGKDKVRQAQDASLKFMSVMAGNWENFEEATRALYAGDEARFNAMIEPWPRDVKAHARKLSADAFSEAER